MMVFRYNIVVQSFGLTNNMNENDYQLKYFETLEKYTDALLDGREYWETSQELKNSLETSLTALEDTFNAICEAGKKLNSLAVELNHHKDDPQAVESLAKALQGFGELLEQHIWQKDTKKMSHQPSTEAAGLVQLVTRELRLKVQQN